MAYNIVLADRSGMTLSVELQPGGGLRVRPDAIATNHQHGAAPATRPEFTRTVERLDHLSTLMGRRSPAIELSAEFLQAPLFQTDYGGGMGTLFTAEYDPSHGGHAAEVARPAVGATHRQVRGKAVAPSHLADQLSRPRR